MFMNVNLHIRYSLHALHSFLKVFRGLLSTNHTWTHVQDLKLVQPTGKLSFLSLEFIIVLPLKGSKWNFIETTWWDCCYTPPVKTKDKYYSRFQCCVYTRIFRHDSTEDSTERLPSSTISWRNQSTQSEIYFNDHCLNVSFVIQKKRTVNHNLFSFSDNTPSHKSRKLIAIQCLDLQVFRLFS